MSTGPVIALLDTVTFPELMTFLVIALVVLGPDKLPGLARSAGQWVAKLRDMAQNLQTEVTGALDESEMQSLKELGEFAVRPRAKLVEYARNAGADPDDHTDGDAPASSPPLLPPLGVGPDNPMVTNGPSKDEAPAEPEPPAEPLPPAERPTPATNAALPAHLAGTRLATGPATVDPGTAPASDDSAMESASTEPSIDEP